MLFRSGHQDVYAAAERPLQLAPTTIVLEILHGRFVEQGDGSILSSTGGRPHGCFQQDTSTPASARGSPRNTSSTSTSRATASRGTASGWYVPGGAAVCHHHRWGDPSQEGGAGGREIRRHPPLHESWSSPSTCTHPFVHSLCLPQDTDQAIRHDGVHSKDQCCWRSRASWASSSR